MIGKGFTASKKQFRTLYHNVKTCG